MTAITTPLIRFAKRDAALNIVAYSEAFSAVSADNTVPPRVVFNRYTGSDDEPRAWGEVIKGRDAEVLEVQVLGATAFTPDQADHTLTDLQIGIMRHYRQQGVLKRSEGTLGPGDRITRSTASTRNDSRGLNDGIATLANEWSPYLRFAPPQGESWELYGYMVIAVHNNV